MSEIFILLILFFLLKYLIKNRINIYIFVIKYILIIYYLLFIIYYLLFIIYYLLFIVLLLIIYY